MMDAPTHGEFYLSAGAITLIPIDLPHSASISVLRRSGSPLKRLEPPDNMID
jgi:hypothetical protein